MIASLASEYDRGSVRDVATAWRKSSFSGGGGSNCVEVAFALTGAAVRDSKNTAGPHLVFCARAWQDFLATKGA